MRARYARKCERSGSTVYAVIKEVCTTRQVRNIQLVYTDNESHGALTLDYQVCERALFSGGDSVAVKGSSSQSASSLSKSLPVSSEKGCKKASMPCRISSRCLSLQSASETRRGLVTSRSTVHGVSPISIVRQWSTHHTVSPYIQLR